MDNIVVHDPRDGFRPTVCHFEQLQQADEQLRTFSSRAVASPHRSWEEDRYPRHLHKNLILCAYIRPVLYGLLPFYAGHGYTELA